MICYVVLAHKLPAQVGRFAARVAPSRVFLHVDARAPGPVWEEFGRTVAGHENVSLLERVPSPWASWGSVRAQLAGLRAAVESGCSHAVLASGQDYLLRPADEVDAYVSASPSASWLTCARVPVAWIGDRDGGMARFTSWHLPVRGRRVRLPLRRRLPSGLVPHYGHANSIVSTALAAWVLEEMHARPELERFFRRTWTPDELFLPTMAMASPYADQVVNCDVYYTDWSAGGAHPRTFLTSDVGALVAAGHGRTQGMPGGMTKLLARKFDMSVDSTVLDALDEQLLGLPPAPVRAGEETG